MLIDEDLMDRVNDLGCALHHLKKAGNLLENCIAEEDFGSSKYEISSTYSIFYKYLIFVCEEYEKITHELEFGKRDKEN